MKKKGQKTFKFPENMIEGSRQHEDQIKRLVANGQLKDDRK